MRNRRPVWLGIFTLLTLIAITASGCGTSPGEEHLTRLTGEGGSEYYPYWSPDGRNIVFSAKTRNNEYDIWLTEVTLQ